LYTNQTGSIRGSRPTFGVHVDTIYDWQNKFSDFSDSIKKDWQERFPHFSQSIKRPADVARIPPRQVGNALSSGPCYIFPSSGFDFPSDPVSEHVRRAKCLTEPFSASRADPADRAARRSQTSPLEAPSFNLSGWGGI